MHDFHLADTIYKTIMDHAAKNNIKKVTKAVIELGSIIEHGEEILPDNLRFNLRMLAEGGPSADLLIVITESSDKNWILKEIEGE